MNDPRLERESFIEVYEQNKAAGLHDAQEVARLRDVLRQVRKHLIRGNPCSALEIVTDTLGIDTLPSSESSRAAHHRREESSE